MSYCKKKKKKTVFHFTSLPTLNAQRFHFYSEIKGENDEYKAVEDGG